MNRRVVRLKNLQPREPMPSKQSALKQALATSRRLTASSLMLATLALLLTIPAAAKEKEVRVSIPKWTHPTPVQKYNQDGVKALKKNNLDAARKLFYKAYLLDPNDPFTLNNLGYLAELS